MVDPSKLSYKKELWEKKEVFNKATYCSTTSWPQRLFPYRLPTHALERCLDMPIRLAGEETYTLPQKWFGLWDLLRRIIEIEHACNSNWMDYNTYITVDSRFLNKGQQQRRGGLHVDGFQGARIKTKTKVTRNYVIANNGGTRFWPRPFVAAYDDSKINIFKKFDGQAALGRDPITAWNNFVYFMDAYTVHESGFASHLGIRNFIRVTFDLKKFDRLGNTHNDLLNYDWKMVARDVQSTLV